MASTFKATYTKPLPPGAELYTREGERFARWVDRHGRKQTARVTTGRDGSDRIIRECSTLTAKYRDGSGIVRTVPTGCRMKDAAASVLKSLTDRAQLVKANVLTAAQSAVADHAATPLSEHFDAYAAHLQAKGTTAHHREEVINRLRRVAADCRFSALAGLSAKPLDGWLVLRAADGMSASTRNAYRESLVAFGNWCVRTDRLIANPFGKVPKADEKADPRRTRRALTEDELRNLLAVAQLRPLAERGRETVRRDDAQRGGKGRATWRKRALTLDTIHGTADRARRMLADKPELVAELEAAGRERALIFKTMVLTGLRKGELASLTVAQLDLEAEPPYIVLDAADEKNRCGSDIPLRADLAADLRAFLGDRLTAIQDAARLKIGEPIPMGLPPAAPVFNVSPCLVRILDLDLKAAGIQKRDERGRTVDVHALRTSFGTHLSKGGVAPRTAQAAMRHSDIRLTMGTYTDPKLLDVAGALNALPSLPLDAQPQAQEQRATGTAGAEPYQETARRLVPRLVPTPLIGGASLSIADKMTGQEADGAGAANVAKTAVNGQKSTPLTTGVNGVHSYPLGESNPCPLAENHSAARSNSTASKALTTPPANACTPACTRTPDEANAFAAAVASIMALPLSDDEKAAAIRKLLAK